MGNECLCNIYHAAEVRRLWGGGCMLVTPTRSLILARQARARCWCSSATRGADTSGLAPGTTRTPVGLRRSKRNYTRSVARQNAFSYRSMAE